MLCTVLGLATIAFGQVGIAADGHGDGEVDGVAIAATSGVKRTMVESKLAAP